MKTTVNQRFKTLLDVNNIRQNEFSEITGIEEKTVSNIVRGAVKQPKSDFFEAIARHYSTWLFWIITGEDRYYPTGEEMPIVFREPEPPPYGQKDEVKALLQTVQQLSTTLENISKLVNDVPALREEVERLKRELEALKKR